MKYKAIAANSKIYFGKDIPNMFMDYAGSQAKFAEGLAEGIQEEDGVGTNEDSKLLHNVNWKISIPFISKETWTGKFLFVFPPFQFWKRRIRLNPFNLLYDN